MTQINITITDPQVVDGLIESANRNDTTAEAIALSVIARQGQMYAELYKVGVTTSAAFMARFTPTEYAAVMDAAQTPGDVQDQFNLLLSEATVNYYDPRLAIGLDTLVVAGLLTAERAQELLAYNRPQPSPVRARNEDGTFKSDDPATPDVDEAWIPAV